MATKNELLTQLGAYDTNTLSRLLKYAEYIIVPEEDSLVNVTMSQMVDKAHALADIHFPEWTDRSKSDFGEFLVELFALFSEKDFNYLNAFSNEYVLEEMAVYSNAYFRAIELGYFPATTHLSRITLTADVPSGDAVVLARGSVRFVFTSPTGKVVYYTNKELVTISSASQQVTMELVEGSYRETNFTFNGRYIRLRDSFIDADTIRVVFNNEVWTKVQSLSSSGINDKHFMVIPEANGSCTILFGKDGYGLPPTLQEVVTVSYHFGSGNVYDSTYVITETADESGSNRIMSTSTFAETSSAILPETIESIRVNAPLGFRSHGTLSDSPSIEAYLKTLPNVIKAKAYVYGNNIIYRVVYTDEDSVFLNVGMDTMCLLDTYVKDKVFMGYAIEGVLNNYVSLANIEGVAYALPGYEVQVQADCIAVIYEYTNPAKLAEYGKNFSRSELIALLLSQVEGLQNFVFDDVQSSGSIDVEIADDEIMYCNLENITVNVITT